MNITMKHETQKATHTPGPWSLETHETNPRNFFKVETGKRVICDAFGHSREDYANARLIAAAPDMLAFLRDLAAEKAKSTQDARMFSDRNLAAIIAKAEGQA